MSSLRVATWNLEHDGNRTHDICLQIKELRKYNADIIILTETSDDADLSSFGYTATSSRRQDSGRYCSVIWSKNPVVRVYNLEDQDTSACALFETRLGLLIVYGTIITWANDGVYEGKARKWERHLDEIARQGEEWKKIIDQGERSIPLCVAGDFNQTRHNYAYATKQTRQNLDRVIHDCDLEFLTESDFGHEGMLKPMPGKDYPRSNIDHVCITKGFAPTRHESFAWHNYTESGEYLSDHNGVYVDLF